MTNEGQRIELNPPKQIRFFFKNGYGASAGLYELAVYHQTPTDPHLTLCYRTAITDDTIGWLTADEVVRILSTIARLRRKDKCKHKSGWSLSHP